MKKLHLDTDIGGDVDDLCALAMVLNWPETEVVGVTSVADPMMVPGTVTMQTWMRRAYLPRLRDAGRLGSLLADQAETYLRDVFGAEYGASFPGLPDDFLNFLHDPLACAVALGWREHVTIEEMPLTFEIEDGLVVERRAEGGKPTRLVTAVDGEAFGKFWLEVLAG